MYDRGHCDAHVRLSQISLLDKKRLIVLWNLVFPCGAHVAVTYERLEVEKLVLRHRWRTHPWHRPRNFKRRAFASMIYIAGISLPDCC